jgi:hypothetical protein
LSLAGRGFSALSRQPRRRPARPGRCSPRCSPAGRLPVATARRRPAVGRRPLALGAMSEMAVVPSGGGPPCSEWARSQGLDPVGSAGHYAGFLLVEQPLPWPQDVSEAPELQELAGVAASAGLRLQALVPRSTPGGDTAQGRALICYRTSRSGWAGRLLRSECTAGPTELAEAATALLAGFGAAEGGGSEGAGDAAIVDVLVCTHGRRDACCGSSGERLFAGMGELAGARQVRVWRTSHTGGHRFAPTVIVLPPATLWAWADAHLVGRVVRQAGPIGDLLGRYRGCATIGPSPQQAVERAVLAEVGWPLLSWERRAFEVRDGVLRLEALGPSRLLWEAEVSEGRHVPQPECRSRPELATKQSVEWVVSNLRRV